MRPLLDWLCYTYNSRLDSFADFARCLRALVCRTSLAVFVPSCAGLRSLSLCPRVQDFAFADVYFVGPREAKAPIAMFSRSHCDDSHSTLSHSSPMCTSTVLVRPIVPSEDLVLLYPAPTLSYSRPCPVQAIVFSLLARCELSGPFLFSGLSAAP